MIIKSFFNY